MNALETVRAVFTFVWRERTRLLAILVPPLALGLAVSLATSMFAAGWGLVAGEAFNLLCYVVAAVRVQRFALLGEVPPAWNAFAFGRREAAFILGAMAILLAIVLVGLAAAGLFFLFSEVGRLAGLPFSGPVNPAIGLRAFLFHPLLALTAVAALWVFARLAPLLLIAAVDGRIEVRRALAVSHGQGPKVLAVLLLTSLPLLVRYGALFLALYGASLVVDPLIARGALPLHAGPWLSLPFFFVFVVLSSALETVTLAMIYREAWADIRPARAAHAPG